MNDIHLITTITYIPTNRGGREGEILSDFRPQFYYDGEDWDAEYSYGEYQKVNPGDTVDVGIRFRDPSIHRDKLVPGKLFLIREGHKVIGYGVVREILSMDC